MKDLKEMRQYDVEMDHEHDVNDAIEKLLVAKTKEEKTRSIL